ncbi:MAG: hypothetical protein SOX25_08400 [Eubacteriales bacterium]|nr:hypothetical protein [Eubacteriales bacterium]
MKKFVALVLAACMLFTMSAMAESTAEYKLGMGVSVSTNSTKDGHAQVDATVATVVLDADGKIVACRLDCAQNKMDVEDGEVNTEATFETKRELRERYNMVAFSDATREWFEQAEAFEAYVVGKTADEVENMETKEHNGHNVTVDDTLFASCSIDITAFKAAVVKACRDEKGQTFTAAGSFTLGLAAISDASESTSVTDDEDAVVKMYTEFGATVVGEDGKIIAAITDMIQPQIKMDEDGKVTDIVFKGTKRELGADYGMVAYGNAIAEWDAQAQAFANYTVGKTAEEVAAIETKVNDHGYSVPADETLLASCTMQVTGMMAVLALAATYAR